MRKARFKESEIVRDFTKTQLALNLGKITFQELGMAATGQRIGYVRVSSFNQNPERQLEGVAIDQTFLDKKSGKDVDREQHEIISSHHEICFDQRIICRSDRWLGQAVR